MQKQQQQKENQQKIKQKSTELLKISTIAAAIFGQKLQLTNTKANT